nr:flagellar motor protein MotB [Eubacterium sp.]
MAREKKEEESSISGDWINTFADLMNLLLCFFVLLFSMSTVDADKYEELVTSLSESIDIFDGGGKAVGEGAFVASGTSQKISMEQYFNEFENSGQNVESQDESSEVTDEEKYQKRMADELKKRTEELYEEISDKAAAKKIQDMINVNMDEQYQYVQISLNGAILFDSGSDQIKKSALPILSKVGDILKIYDSHMIKIEGHTDNIPISGGKFANNMWLSTARATQVFEYFVNKKDLSPETLETTGRSEYEPVASNKTEKGRAKNRRVEIKIYTDK